MRAAPDALQLLESAVPAQAQKAAMQTWVQRFVGSLLKQSVERIARVREVGFVSSGCCAVAVCTGDCRLPEQMLHAVCCACRWQPLSCALSCK